MNTPENKEKTGAERRVAKRVYASFVEYCRAEDTSGQRYQAFAENISAVGICLFLGENIPVDSFLFITVYLLDGTIPIELKGRVIWSRPSVFVTSKSRQHYDAGIVFAEISDEDRTKLIQYSTKYAHEIPPEEKSV